MKCKSFILFCFYFYAPVLAYKAAVYDYNPSIESTPQSTILKNIENYRSYVEEVNNQSVNIFIFPEYGLTGLVTDPSAYAVEIKNDDDVIQRLKAIASDHSVYLVVSLLEKASDKYYSTVLVFNRDGYIEHTYRKINLYREPNLTPGASDQKLTFDTDFGLGTTFGVFAGRDILFENPSRRVLADGAVKDVIYPTLWHSVMPFLTSLSVQRGYADANGVNLLAAGFGRPNQGHGGSGIYSGDGNILEAYIADSASSKPIIQDVRLSAVIDKTVCPETNDNLPTEHPTANVINYNTMKLFTTANATFLPLDPSVEQISLCLGIFCCYFEQSRASDNPQEIYKGMYFDGELDLGDGPTFYQICSVLACSSDANESCGDRIENVTTQFRRISVSSRWLFPMNKLAVPVTVSSYLLPVENTQYCQINNTAELATLQGAENVLVFGLVWGSPSNAAEGGPNDDGGEGPNDDTEGQPDGAAAFQAYEFFFLVAFTVVKFFIF